MTGACRHDDPAQRGLAGLALDRALGLAEARCALTRQRLTPPRRRVLARLLQADAPLKAYDLVAACGDAGASAKPPTVYRALAFLERQGLAHRIESLNAYVPCRLSAAPHAAAFLICDCCGAAEEFAPDFGPQLAAATARGYAVASVTLEARGRCPACRD